MPREWPPDFFPALVDPQKSLCQGIMLEAMRTDRGMHAVSDLRMFSNSLECTSEAGIQARIMQAKIYLISTIGQDKLDILLGAFAEDVGR